MFQWATHTSIFCLNNNVILFSIAKWTVEHRTVLLPFAKKKRIFFFLKKTKILCDVLPHATQSHLLNWHIFKTNKRNFYPFFTFSTSSSSSFCLFSRFFFYCFLWLLLSWTSFCCKIESFELILKQINCMIVKLFHSFCSLCVSLVNIANV